MPISQPKISGTREWSVASVNCVNGCGHRCRYCYARAAAVRRKLCPSLDAWGTTYHFVRPSEVRKRRQKIAGRIMFPTTHDIEPEFLGPCLTVLENLLKVGNDVLIVTKPHLECIQAICERLAKWRDQILFRFSIGAADYKTLNYWEPGAPSITERYYSLKWAHHQGFATSVSAEPLLNAIYVDELTNGLSHLVTDTIWIGKMNKPRLRCPPDTDSAALAMIEDGQTDEAVHRVYERLKDNPKIRWKESYKEILGLPASTEAGMD